MEFDKFNKEPTPANAMEVAAALQRVYRDLPDREHQLDLHQDAAIQAIGASLAQGKRSGYVEMATSTGKTFIESVLAEAAVLAGKRVLMLAPSVQIADQISGHDSNTGLGKFSNLHESGQVRQHYASRRANSEAPVVVSTYQGLLSEIKSDTPRLGQFDVIIADECHRSLGQATSQALTTYMPDAIKIGFSATPDYADDRKSEEIYDQPLFEYSLLSAIESGITAPVRPVIYETGQSLELSNIRAEFTETELAPLIANMERNGAALNLVQDLVSDGRRGIVACVPGLENAHARLMARLISEAPNSDRQIKAVEVGSHLSRDEQLKRLAAYAKGDIDVLTFTRTLEEGWDSQDTSFCLNLAPTTSPVRTKQLLGRVLRPNPDGKTSIYVDFVDAMSGIAKQQYTSYHALELEDIDLHRTLGRRTEHAQLPYKGRQHITNIDALFSGEIYQQLLRSHGKSLRDVTVSKNSNAVDPMVLFWERRLEKEGLPAELPYNIALPSKTDQAVRKTAARLLENSIDTPDIMTIIDEVPGTNHQKQLLAGYAVRVAWDEPTMNTLPEVDDSTEEAVENVFIEQQNDKINRVFNTISEREAGVIALRFGLTDGEPKTIDEISKVYGVTKGRITQVESKAMKKILHPFRTNILAGLLELDETPPSSARIPKPEHTGLSADDSPTLAELQERAETSVKEYQSFLSSDVARNIRKHLTDSELGEIARQTDHQLTKASRQAYDEVTEEIEPRGEQAKKILIARTRFQRATALQSFIRYEQSWREDRDKRNKNHAEDATT
jgi:superfamily II DNA or RNA helicase